MTATAETSPPSAPDTAKDAARLLHAALEQTCWHFHACYPTTDSATKQIIEDNRALLEVTRAAAGRGSPNSMENPNASGVANAHEKGQVPSVEKPSDHE